MTDKFHSPLYKAKGKGAAGDGVHHWWMQRLTAIILVPVTLWAIWQFKSAEMTLRELLILPYNFVAAIIFIFTAFYHAKLGMAVVIEDYISNIRIRFVTLILLELFVMVTVVTTLTTLLYLQV